MAYLSSRRTSSLWVILSFRWLLSSAQIVVVTSQCSICPFTQVVTLPDAIIPEGTGGFILSDLTCAETEALAQGGEFSLGECVILRASGVSGLCGCQEPPDPTATPADPTAAPAESTEPPVATPAPTTSAPVQGPPPPTQAPTDEPITAPPPTPAPVEATDAPTETPETEVPTTTPIDSGTPAPTTAAPVDEPPPPTAAPTDGNDVGAPPTAAPAPGEVNTVPPTMEMTEPQPTKVPFPTVTGTISIRTISVGPGDLTDEADDGFAAACAAFYTDLIIEAGNYVCSVLSSKVEPVPGANRARLIRQRGLQNSTAEINYLDVLTQLRGSSKTFEYTPSTAEFSLLMIDTLNGNSKNFSDLLRTTGSAESQLYFDDALSIQAYEQDKVPIFTAPPTAVPVSPGAPVTPPTAGSGDDDNKLSGGAIAGIVAACVVGSVAVVGGAKYMAKSNPEPRPSVLEVGNPTGDFETTPTTSIAAPRKSKVDTATAAAAAAATSTKLSTSQISSKEPSVASSAAPAKRPSSSDPSGIKTASDSQISTGLASAQPSEFAEEDSAVTGSDIAGDKDGEDMSYAYSLDPGNMEAQSTVAGGTAGSATGGDGGGGTDGMDKSESGSEMSSHAMSSLRQNMVSRTVVAPPGKLGIVIDTTLEGPVVHKVNPQSPLEGTLFPGDIIVAIDDVDTRAMSASAITALMVRTANLRRKLTVLSEDNTS